jgi:uncharacterized protein (TIGR00288 family)
MNLNKKVAFLVDFDNVATDVIEQALNAVFKDYGAAHIRRAYCNAEQALREQNFLKRLGLRAIVNLAIGKNSTDIALAVDAMDLAITEKPDVIVLVSSDSDFAPLVLRLREKGAWLRGFGQYGKTGDGVIQIYDQFNELAHDSGRGGRDSAPAKAGSRRRGGARSTGRPVAEAPRMPARQQTAEPPVSAPPAPVVELTAVPAPVEAAAPKPATKAARPARKAAAKTAAATPAPVKPTAPAKAKPAAKAAAAPADKQVAAAKEINAVLALLPKLIDGQWHDLGAAAKVLKEAGLLAKSAPATKLFRKHPHAFELQPEKQPNQVRFAT